MHRPPKSTDGRYVGELKGALIGTRAMWQTEFGRTLVSLECIANRLHLGVYRQDERGMIVCHVDDLLDTLLRILGASGKP